MKKINIFSVCVFLTTILNAQIWENNLRNIILNPSIQEKSDAFETYRQNHKYSKTYFNVTKMIGQLTYHIWTYYIILLIDLDIVWGSNLLKHAETTDGILIVLRWSVMVCNGM